MGEFFEMIEGFNEADTEHALRVSIVRITSTIRESLEGKSHPDRLPVDYWKNIQADVEVLQSLRAMLDKFEESAKGVARGETK